jgi:hypothetical protein
VAYDTIHPPIGLVMTPLSGHRLLVYELRKMVEIDNRFEDILLFLFVSSPRLSDGGHWGGFLSFAMVS